MTEPIHTNSQLPISDSLRSVLDILNTYRSKLIQENTLRSQKPQNALSNSNEIVKRKGKQLLNSIMNAQNFLNNDEDVKEVMRQLWPYLEKQDYELTTTMKDWIRKMFDEWVFVLRPEHIDNLLKSSQSLAEPIKTSQQQIDGVPTQNQEIQVLHGQEMS